MMMRRNGDAVRPASPQGGFTLLEMLIVLVLIGILGAASAGILSLERHPLLRAAHILTTSASAARATALLRNTPVTLRIGSTFAEVSAPGESDARREDFPARVLVIEVSGHSMNGKPYAVSFHPLGVAREQVIRLQHGSDELSVYLPATGTARILQGSYSLEQIRKEFL